MPPLHFKRRVREVAEWLKVILLYSRKLDCVHYDYSPYGFTSGRQMNDEIIFLKKYTQKLAVMSKWWNDCLENDLAARLSVFKGTNKSYALKLSLYISLMTISKPRMKSCMQFYISFFELGFFNLIVLFLKVFKHCQFELNGSVSQPDKEIL